MVANIKAIGDLARERFGVRAVIHPHEGGFIEFADEIARVAHDIPQATAGLCLDTGHVFYAGKDPVETLEKYADRLDYVHFKDIDRAKFDEVMGREIRFFEACAEGVMRRSAAAASTIRRSAPCSTTSATRASSPSSRSATLATRAGVSRT